MVQLAHIFKKDKDKDREKQHTSESKKDHRKDKKETQPQNFSTARKSPSKPSPKPKSPSKNRFVSHSRSSSSSSSSHPTAPPSFRFGPRSSKDQDLHPLNLPPDELRRRLSAMAGSRDDQRSSMDIDQNGVNGTGKDCSPTPPPHRSNSSSTDEADNFKLAGNKFFKDGDYRRAIEEYNKGML